ncbi:MAG: sulfurtransferase complex subunit TusC, partial [Pseudomonas sp.]
PSAMLFLDDGVFQMQPAQQANALQQKDLTANLQALPLFGIDALYSSARSLEERGLASQPLSPATEALDDAALTVLIAQYDQVITL